MYDSAQLHAVRRFFARSIYLIMPHMRRIGSDMMQYLIMCRSMTYAQRSAALLERSGITAKVVKAPQGLSSSGCGYGVYLYRHFNEARELLKKNNMISGKIFFRNEDGEYQEIS